MSTVDGYEDEDTLHHLAVDSYPLLLAAVQSNDAEHLSELLTRFQSCSTALRLTSLLFEASSLGHLQIVKALLAAGATSFLSSSVFDAHALAILASFSISGADVNGLCAQGETALAKATRGEHLAVMEELIQRGAMADYAGHGSALLVFGGLMPAD
jgi:ankyrin repeat protein